jgi:FtsH-binding integral membrane protein
MLSLLCLFSFISIFINVQAIMLGQLYLGLAVFCGYVVYDTQVILEKARMGVTDPIGDSIKVWELNARFVVTVSLCLWD